MSERETDTAMLLISWIRSALRGERFQLDGDVDWNALLAISARHNLQYIVAAAGLEHADLLTPELLQKMQKIYLQTDVICKSQSFEADRLMRLFSERGISVMPIKGICTRRRYPDGRLRSMGDLDFLYPAEKTGAVHAAMAELGYEDFREGRKHDSYRLPPYIVVEMHRDMLAAENALYDYCSSAWSRVQHISEMRNVFRMTTEDEYVFNLIHFAEHLQEGGAGIRFVMDVFVYEHIEMDRAYLAGELQKTGLQTFYENVRAIAERWFGEPKTALTEVQARLAAFLLDSGTFGIGSNSAAIAVSGGRVKSFLQLCFPGYRSMRSMFPWLEKAPALLPYSWALRGYRAVRYRPDRVRHKWRQLVSGDREKGIDLHQFLADCGL